MALPDDIQQLYSLGHMLEWRDVFQRLEWDGTLVEWRGPDGVGLLGVLGDMPGAEAVIPTLFGLGCTETGEVLEQLLESCIERDSPYGLRTIGAFQALLRLGASPNGWARGCSGYNLLQLALIRDKPDFVQALLEAGADPCVKERDYEPRDAFGIAASHQNRASKALFTWAGRSTR